MIPDDEAGVIVFDGPRRPEAARLPFIRHSTPSGASIIRSAIHTSVVSAPAAALARSAATRRIPTLLEELPSPAAGRGVLQMQSPILARLPPARTAATLKTL